MTLSQEDMKNYLGDLCKIFLKNNYVYTGKIIKVTDKSVSLIDKYNNKVVVALEEISSVRGAGNGNT